MYYNDDNEFIKCSFKKEKMQRLMNIVGHFDCYSTAGVGSMLYFARYKIMFDCGMTHKIHKTFTKLDRLFVTHCHSDHIATIPMCLNYRGLLGITKPLEIYLPIDSNAKQLKKLLDVYSELTIHKLDYEVFVMDYIDTIQKDKIKHYNDGILNSTELIKNINEKDEKNTNLSHIIINNDNYSKAALITSFPTQHVIKSQGYCIWDYDHHLNYYKLIVAYTGDTTIEVLKMSPHILKAQVLFIECTFISDNDPREKATSRGHIHILDIAENAKLFENELIVLLHISQKYKENEIYSMIESKLEPSLLKKILIVNPRKKC